MESELHSSEARVAWVVIVSSVLCISVAHPCRSGPLQDTSEAFGRYDPVFGNACGAVNLYGALRILGKDADFEQVVSSCNLDGYGRSDLAILEKTAAAFGLSAQCVQMNVGSLRAWDGLAILHMVKPRDHFVLCTGTVEGKFRLLDGTHRRHEPAARLVSGRDLQKVWDGNALALALHEIDIRKGVRPALFVAPVAGGLALGLALLGAISFVTRRAHARGGEL
jgi:hypothetical protein